MEVARKLVLRDQIGTQIDSMANLVGRMYEAEMIRCQIMDLSYELIYQCLLFEIIVAIFNKILTVIPHHWHRTPVRHSADQHDLRHLTHLELFGKFPSWKWWVVPVKLFGSFKDFAGSYVALSTQFGTANSWQDSWRK